MAKKEKALKAVGGIGHNSGELNDDQLQALTRQHAEKRSILVNAEKKAKADRMNFDKLIKAELGAKGLADIKLLEQLSTPEGEAELKAEMERQARVARWAGLQVGTQGSLFDEDRRTVGERAFDEGKRIGLSGGDCKPTHQPGTEAYEKFVEGWHAGQAVLAAGFKKPEAELLRPESEDEDEGNDDFDAAANGDFGDDTYRPGDEVDVETGEEPFEPPAFLRADTETAGAA
jgi:hypothetical protein